MRSISRTTFLRMVSAVFLIAMINGDATAIYIWTVGDAPYHDFPSIQPTVNAANAGDIIIVYEGTYNENVDVNKQLYIYSQAYITSTPGASSYTHVIAAEPYDPTFYVTADGVRISGFTVSGGDAGIYLDSSSNNMITDNTVSNDNCGIWLFDSSNNTLTDNTAASNFYYGIYLDASSNNTLTNNTASNNFEHGIYLDSSSNNTLTNNTASNNDDFGIWLFDSSNNNTLINNTVSYNSPYGICLQIFSNNNTLTDNTVSNNNYGIFLDYSSNNKLTDNTVSYNSYGIWMFYSSNNTLYNNFFNNSVNCQCGLNIGNVWNTTQTEGTNIVGGPYIGGNYWAKPDGTGFSQTNIDTNGDGFCDSPESEYIFGDNTDYLPLTSSLNYAPIANVNSPYSGTEGIAIIFDGSGSYDPDEDSLTYAWDFGDGTTGVGVNPAHTYAVAGTYTVTLIVNDSELDSEPVTTTATISESEANNPPIADANGPYIVDEGSVVTLDASASSDPDEDLLLYRWDFDNNGIWDTEWSPNKTANYTWYDDWSGVVKLEVNDSKLTAINTSTVTVNNVAPNITAITMQPAEPVEIGTVVNLTANFTDPGSMDTHNYTIDWGDDTITEPVPATDPIKDNHTYTTTGVYTVNLTVTDDDGGLDTEVYQYVVVYDPAGGFVTGHGSINSPEGAYVEEPALTGVARFGFISKYKQGQSTPSGTTQFRFQTAGLTFYSDDYDWLVVNMHKAMYKGTGTLNDIEGYGFMIFAIDEKNTPSTDVDLFRIKIWDKDTEDIVYDNGVVIDPDTEEYLYLGEDADPVTEIFSGQIVITPDK